MAGAIAQDRQRCQFPFLVDEKPAFVPGGSATERSGGTRKISCGVARSNSGRAALSACVGKRFSAAQIIWNRSTRRAGARAGRGSVGPNDVILGKELASPNTVVGNPLASGATVDVIANGASPSQQTLRASRRAAGVSRAIFGRSVATAAPRGRLRLKLALVVSAALGDEVAIVLEEEVGQLLTTAFGHLGDLLEVLFARRTR
jgi:hypothetical protein